MNWKFKQILGTFQKGGNYKILKDSEHGIERECLRTTKNGQLSQTVHPKKLGAASKNFYITTDFAESQLELITPVFKKEESALAFLKDIHLFVNENLKNELIWSCSMPCQLPAEKDIPLAQYGKSRAGQSRTLYRLGLSERYGRKMQTISGTHYNFSFSQKFWQLLHKKVAPKQDKNKFISDAYLHLIRNFLRYSWLNTYLFGAAPAIDKSYLKEKHRSLKKINRQTYYGPHATSLRLSELGYYSKVQTQLAISFNSLEDYIYDMRYAIAMPNPKYKGMKGLNNHVLQIENEHYSRIRPKQPPQQNETPIEALENRGIKYVEVRAVDINPYEATGLKKDQMCFLHVFLVYCFFKPSPKISKKEESSITTNQNRVALYGRRSDLKLTNDGKEVDMQIWAEKLLDEMQAVAELMDKNFPKGRYSNSLKWQLEKLRNPDLTPSAKILTEMKDRKESFLEFGLRLSKKHQKEFKNTKLSKIVEQKFKKAAEKSIKDQNNLEIIEDTLLEGHEDMEISTQILIREANKRKIQAEILDRKENFILLTKGRKHQYIKQATKTSKDSYITALIMENKNVSKQIMAENFIKVPIGDIFLTEQIAINAYPEFSKIKCVVKPTTSNYGIAVAFINPDQKDKFSKAVKNAFKYSKTIVVEKFVEGEEYRFLVINYRTLSVLHRIPANVVGDGENNIRDLIKIKNNDATTYKFLGNDKIQAGIVEKRHLNAQGLTFKSIPRKGQQIFLRTNSNVSTGGDPIDYTDKIPVRFKKIAEKAARLVGAKICGVDIIINKNDYSIIELNFNPALHMHMYPAKGKGKNVAKPVLDLLGF